MIDDDKTNDEKMRSLESLDDRTEQAIVDLIRLNFSARESLYAAANALDNEQLAEICRRLADDLGGHAAELQQLVLAFGDSPEAADSLEMYLDTATLELLKQRRGEMAVLAQAEAREQEVKQRYDETIRSARHSEMRGVLLRQREKTQFGVNVLRSIRRVREGRTES